MIVTYWTPCETAVDACPARSTIFAPVFASLKFLPEIAEFAVRIRE